METSTNKGRFWAFVEHPRTAFIGALVLAGVGLVTPHGFAYVLWGAAGFLILRSGWEWEPVRQRVPIDFHAPITWRGRTLRPVPVLADLGRVDFELYMVKSSAAITRVLTKMGTEMERGGRVIARNAGQIGKLTAESPVAKRHRALARGARVIHRHAQRLSRQELKYRPQVAALVGNSRRLIEATPATEDIDGFAAPLVSFRDGVLISKNGTVDYQASVLGVRSQNISQSVNGATDELAAVLGRIMDEFDTMIAFCDWVAEIAVQRKGH